MLEQMALSAALEQVLNERSQSGRPVQHQDLAALATRRHIQEEPALEERLEALGPEKLRELLVHLAHAVDNDQAGAAYIGFFAWLEQIESRPVLSTLDMADRPRSRLSALAEFGLKHTVAPNQDL
jgi:hypothetical protein